MLRTERIAPATPLKERIGQVNDPRLMPLIEDIDKSLGALPSRRSWTRTPYIRACQWIRGNQGHTAATAGRVP